MDQAPSPKYWAFLSYSHKDKAAAEWLHRSLEKYRIPKALQGRATGAGQIPSRLFPIFRDREELSAAPELGARLEEALRDSRHLIVICSPNSATSPWVSKEIIYFKSLGREARVFSLVVAGEPNVSGEHDYEKNECFPLPLRYRVGPDSQIQRSHAADPLAADARAGKDGKDEALLKLIAGMLGVGFDTLRQRDLEQRNAKLRRIVGAGMILVTTFAGLAYYAWAQQQRAEERSRVALSRQYAAQAVNEIGQNLHLAFLLAIAANRDIADYEARRSLQRVLTAQPHLHAFLTGHTVGVSSVAFSPDGALVATASGDHTIRLWSVTTQTPVRTLQADAEVRGVAFNPEGKMLAAAGSDGTVSLWNVNDGSKVNVPLPKHTDVVTAVAFSHDGTKLASSSEDRTVILWDLVRKKIIGNPLKANSEWAYTVAFSIDDKTLASSYDDSIVIWRIEDQTKMNTLKGGHKSRVTSIAFSPDGKTLASASWDKTIQLWNLGAPGQDKPHQKFVSQPSEISSIAFSHDGSMLASAAWDGSVNLWDVLSRQNLTEQMKGHQGTVSSVVFSPDDRMLLSGGTDRLGILWKVANNDHFFGQKLEGHQDRVTSVAFHPTGKTLASASWDHTVRLWDIAGRIQLLAPFDVLHGEVTSVSFTHDGDFVAAGFGDGSLALWKPFDPKVPATRSIVPKGWLFSLAFSPDGKSLVSGHLFDGLVLWDATKKSSIAQVFEDSVGTSVSGVSFSPDGRLVAGANWKNAITLCDLSSNKRKCRTLPEVHKGRVLTVSFSRDGTMLASAGADKNIIIWDTKRWVMVGKLVGHLDSVTAIDFSPNGNILASGSLDGTVRLWDLKRLAILGEPFRGHQSTIWSVAFSPNGKIIASGSADRTVMLWDVDINSWQSKARATIKHDLTDRELDRFIENSATSR